jgi:hypothetical protein
MNHLIFFNRHLVLVADDRKQAAHYIKGMLKMTNFNPKDFEVFNKTERYIDVQLLLIAPLDETDIQVNRAYYHSLVGKKVMCPHSGLLVEGVVIGFSEDKHAFTLDIIHEPVNWGGMIFTRSNPFARKIDNWGSLNNVKLIS